MSYLKTHYKATTCLTQQNRVRFSLDVPHAPPAPHLTFRLEEEHPWWEFFS